MRPRRSLEFKPDKKKKVSTERVRRFREKQRERPDYDHEKVKEETRLRIAAIRANKPKCPLGRKCKDLLCGLHPDRGRNRSVLNRQERGNARRRKNQRINNDERKILQIKVDDLTNSNRRLQRKLREAEEKATAINDASIIIHSMSPSSKRKTLQNLATTPGLSPTKKRLRKFANIRVRDDRFTESAAPVSNIADKIIQFMQDDGNSFECPDKDKQGVRYRRDTIEMLHERFLSETLLDCSLSTFARYVPENIKKPRPEDWGTSLCKTCLNPELKVESLKDKTVTLEKLLTFNESELEAFSKMFSQKQGKITYKEWQSQPVVLKKVSKEKDTQGDQLPVQTKSYRSNKVILTENYRKFVKKLLIEVTELKKHNEIKISQYRRIKEIRKIVNDPKNKAAALRMDWSENAKLFQCRQEKSAYYHDIQIAVNTVVLYQANEDVTSVGSLCDNTNHNNYAVWASLKSMFVAIDFNIDNIETLYIITDSPTSQYRNAGCTYLSKRFAEENNIDINWVFTESGHGKGPMDGVGSAIKNAIDDAVISAESMSLVTTCASDVCPLLNLPNVAISQYSDVEIDREKGNIPKNLSIKWKGFGISKVHEIFFSKEKSEELKWKQKSGDENFISAKFFINKKGRSISQLKVLKALQTPGNGDLESDNEERREEEGDSNENEKSDCEENRDSVDSIDPFAHVELVPIAFNDIKLKSWVLVIYEGEKFLGRTQKKIITKDCRQQIQVRCLNKPFGIRLAQDFEPEIDSMFYDTVYQAPVTPWETELDDDGNRTRKTFYKY